MYAWIRYQTKALSLRSEQPWTGITLLLSLQVPMRYFATATCPRLSNRKVVSGRLLTTAHMQLIRTRWIRLRSVLRHRALASLTGLSTRLVHSITSRETQWRSTSLSSRIYAIWPSAIAIFWPQRRWSCLSSSLRNCTNGHLEWQVLPTRHSFQAALRDGSSSRSSWTSQRAMSIAQVP